MRLLQYLLLLLFQTLIFTNINAQVISDFRLYSYNHALFNPGATGIEEVNQLSLNGRFENSKYANLSGLAAYSGFYGSRHGVGISAFSHGNKLVRNFQLSSAYSYKIEFDEKMSLRIGARLTASEQKIDRKEYEEVFGHYPGESEAGINVGNIDLGLHFKYRSFYLGLSGNDLIQRKWYWRNFFEPSRRRSGTLITGNVFQLTDNLKWDPSIAFTYFDHSFAAAFNNNLTLNNKYLVGMYLLSLDETRSVGLNGGINLWERVQLVGMIYSRDNWRSSLTGKFKTFEGSIRIKL